mmetsp:Transcript_30756/g.98238  ORF Transcript_30756/g.98238 Transcript_30756/m.98238 type:complete len:522 (+) Transcript_30756:266-1831(+)
MPVSASSPTAADGGGFGVASLRTIAPAAYVASFADTLPHLSSLPRTAALVANPASFAASPTSPALRELAGHFHTLTSDPLFQHLRTDPRSAFVYKSLTTQDDEDGEDYSYPPGLIPAVPDDPDPIPAADEDPASTPPPPARIARLFHIAGRHAQRPLSLVLQRRTSVALTSGPLPLDVKCSIVQASQYGAGVFLNTVGTYDAVRITNKEYLNNVWHRFGFFAPLNILADASCARTCPTFSPGRPTNAAFLSAAHSLSCSSCGSLKRHNAVAYGPLADHFKSQDFDFIKEHTVLESFGKKAVDGLLRNPYLSSAQTALDVTITCPACPSYVSSAAAACNTRCTDAAEAAKHLKYDQIATTAGVLFSVAAFTTYGGWGSEFRNKYVEPFYKSELKEAKAKGGDGWEVLNRKSRFVRHVAAVICRENSRMLSNAARMRPAGSRVVARGPSSSSLWEYELYGGAQLAPHRLYVLARLLTPPKGVWEGPRAIVHLPRNTRCRFLSPPPCAFLASSPRAWEVCLFLC